MINYTQRNRAIRCEVNGLLIGTIESLSDCIYYFQPVGDPMLGAPVLKELLAKMESLGTVERELKKQLGTWSDVL